jgi:tetraacyldisaccharide 4'-kinase
MVRKRSILLFPLSLIYGLLTAFRNFLYNTGILQSHEFRFPVICVGNLAAGGTGKTPHTEYLANLLQKDFRVAVLSRGYKRKSSGFRYVHPHSLPCETGDEPLQIARKFPEITVAVDGNRVHGIKKIMEDRPDTDVILLDDGFQHRKLTPGFSILLTDYNNPLHRDCLLPYGNLRENRHNMRRADIILVSKCPPGMTPIDRRIMVRDINKAAYQNLFFTSFTYGQPAGVFNVSLPKGDFLTADRKEKRGMLLVTGIVNPEPLEEYLSGFFGEIMKLTFNDHHSFTDKDIADINEAYLTLRSDSKYLITTEKDAVRLKEFVNIAENLRSSSYYIPVEISFLNDDGDEFDNLIRGYVRKNKRNNRISQE